MTSSYDFDEELLRTAQRHLDEDPRTAGIGARVFYRDGGAVLTGEIADDGERARIHAVLQECVPALPIIDHLRPRASLG